MTGAGEVVMEVSDVEASVSQAALDTLANNRWLEGHQATALHMRRGAFALRELQRLRSVNAATASQADAGWRPIETAPDETDVLIYCDGWASGGEARKHGDQGWWLAGNDPTDAHGWRHEPTHWRPLPAPPSAPSRGGGGE